MKTNKSADTIKLRTTVRLILKSAFFNLFEIGIVIHKTLIIEIYTIAIMNNLSLLVYMSKYEVGEVV